MKNGDYSHLLNYYNYDQSSAQATGSNVILAH
jgi:hypothetical protein